MGKSQRVKGHSFERLTAKELREIGFENAKRNLEYQSDTRGVDVTDCDPFEIQCKIGKTHSVRANYQEIMPKKNCIGILRVKWDREDDLAVLNWKDFKWILRKLKESKLI